MAKDKLVSRMRANPRGDWTIEDLLTVAVRFGIEVAPGKGSHRIFRFPDRSILSVPARRPIKAVYIKQFTDKLVN
jgi:predicted RNA binding protein YcfA (HicA-like mRNA interferase family)